MTEWNRVLNLVLLGIGWIFSFGSIALYIATQKSWWKNGIGQLLIALSASVGLFYFWFFLVTLWPGIPGRNLIRTLLFFITTAVIVWRFIILSRLLYIVRKDNDTTSLVEKRSSDT